MIKNIVIAGAGTMGASMAECFSGYGFRVYVYDVFEKSLENGKNLIYLNQETLVNEGLISKEKSAQVIQNLSFHTDIEIFKEADLVVESITEEIEIKSDFYSKISNIVNDNCIICSNTSALPITLLSKSVNKPERFLGMHWFNPPHIIPLIEIIKSDKTDYRYVNLIYDLSKSIDKQPVIVNKDIKGFVANRIQFAVLREALYLVDNDVISVEDIDKVMKYALGFRYACFGPLEIADFGGLDTFEHISKFLNPNLCNDTTISKSLVELVENNNYGIKNGKGFYDYSNGKDTKAIQRRDELYLKLTKLLTD